MNRPSNDGPSTLVLDPNSPVHALPPVLLTHDAEGGPMPLLGAVIGALGPERADAFVQQIALLLLLLFNPRLDAYAQRVDTEEEAARRNAWQAERDPDGKTRRVWRVGEWYPVRQSGQYAPITARAVASHVVGYKTVGIYPLHPDGTCNSVSADFDNHRGSQIVTADPLADLRATARVLDELQVPYLTNRSRGGHGFWLHLLLPAGTPAREARLVLHFVLERAGVRHVSDGGTFDCLFPKQDAPSSPKNLGNLLCLPLNLHWMSQDSPGTSICGFPSRDLRGQIEHLANLRRVDPEHWVTLVAMATAAAPANSDRETVRTSASGPVSDTSRRVTPRRSGDSAVPASPLARPSAWFFALLQAGRLGQQLGDGKFAVLCINDQKHSNPDFSADRAGGSCVLMPPGDDRNLGWPHCSHAHCQHLTLSDWITAVGRDVWEASVRLAQGGAR